MSEANVFYTTIKNVNYPSKDEIRGVKVGSMVGSKVGSSDAHPVDIYGTSKRLSRDDLINRISKFCIEWRSPDDISVYTGKNLRYIKEKILSTMSSKGILERLYPDTPNHPKQKYRSKR